MDRRGDGVTHSPNQTDFLHLLGADEKVLWQGPISFNFFSSPVFTMVLVVATVITIWGLAGYEPNDSASPRQAFGNLAIRPTLIVILFFQILAMLERRALSLGRANGKIILTDQRLLRVCDWCKLRVRARGHYGKRIATLGGFLTVGELGWFVLSRDTASNLQKIIAAQREAHP